MPADTPPTTRLVGRDDELRRIRDRLDRARLVTLTGPGGIGKTTLARRILEEHRAAGGEARWVDLTTVGDDAGLLPAIAAALGVSGPEPTTAALGAFLSSRSGLLVLDNLESIAGRGVARALGALLPAAMGLRILATSRVPIGVDGEQQHPVPGLALPPGDDPQLVASSPAGALFLARSELIGVTPDLDAGGARALAAVLRRLDGMPLAIELAAGRSRVLTPAGLLRRLGDPATLARERTGEAEDRHGSLAGVLDVTLSLLGPDEWLLLAGLAACPGSFDLALAGALAPTVAAVPALDALVAAGLVKADGELLGERRFRMLETIRDRVASRVDEADAAVAQERLAHHIAVLTASLAAELRGRGQAAAIARASVERPSIAAALDWSVANDPELGLAILSDLDMYWGRAPDSAAALRWLTTLLDLAPPTTPARAPALVLQVELLLRYRGPAVAAERLGEALALAEASGSLPLRRRALAQAAEVHWATGATAALGDSLIAAAGYADNADDATGLRLSGEAHRAIAAGDFRRARELLAASAAAHGRSGNRWNEGITLFCCAEVDWRLGLPAVAAATARSADDLVTSAGGELDARPVLVMALAGAGEVGAALDVLRRAWTVVEHDIPISRTELLESAATLLVAMDRHEEALSALAVAARERARTGWSLDPMTAWLLERTERDAAHALGPVRAGLAVRAATGLTLDDVIAATLAPAHPVPQVRRPPQRTPTSLTAREVEVLALVAQGRSDGEIAAELFISRKTASVHVANIKGKLGLDSRLQVALHARAMGLAPGGTEPTVN